MVEIRSLVVAGGGTGGHLFPGLAIAEEFRRRHEGVRAVYIGVKGKMEEKLVPEAGLDFYGLDVRGLRGRGVVAAAAGLLLAVRALTECRRLLLGLGPDLLIGVGGYSSGPAALAAWRLGIPLVLQEQNTVPGMTNRLLGRLAARVFLAFEGAAAYFPARRTVVTGNPIRREALGEAGEVGSGRDLKVLVLGGSRGARGLNSLVVQALPRLAGERILFLHQSGEEDREWVGRAHRDAGSQGEVAVFLDRMGERYGWADLVISRSGAGAVSEIAAAGRPAVLVPFPRAAGGHQRKNARWLQEQGGAAVVEEAEPEAAARLAGIVMELAGDREKLRRMAAMSKGAGRRDAAARIVEECEALLQKRRG